MPVADQNIVTALDIGTSKVAVLTARMEAGEVEIIAVSTVPSHGLKRGVVVNIEQAVDSIQAAAKEAEIIGEVPITSVYVGVAGSHIDSFDCEGMAPIKDNEVTQFDVDQAVDTAQAIQLPVDQCALHVIARDFAVDDRSGIKDPTGMSGYRLHANVHMVTAGVHPLDDVKRCVKRCGLKIERLVLEQIASGLATLTDDEKELGVCLVDIGGGTSDLAVFEKGEVAHTSVIPIGGDHVTNDIAVTLRTPTKNAEEIKVKYGCAMERFARENETIKVPGVADRPAVQLERQSLARIIEPRYEELFELIVRKLQQDSLDKLAVTGFVLTGGSSKMEAVLELAESVFNAPVRLGRPLPDKISGLTDVIKNPIHSTGVGLLLYAVDMSSTESRKEPTGIRSFWDQAREWYLKNF